MVFSLNSCRKDYKYIGPIVPLQDSLSFAANIYPILTSYGCGCHNGNSKPPKLSSASIGYNAIMTGTSLSGLPYINLGAPASSPFYIALTDQYTGTSGQMPAGGDPLTGPEQLTVLTWIEQGAKP